jgi:serine/threonine protein kinase
VVSAPDIPGHKVAGVLGKGGFATVYRSWQLAVGREVAVKVDNRVLFSERDRRRFFREVTAAGRLSSHPHVIGVYDAGTLTDGRPYIVMELCPAGSLNDAVRRHGPMSPARARDIGIRIADALAAAHAAGILHRDIKPANILVNQYGMVGLSDFGLASIVAAEGEQSATRETLTPAYASPETFRCEEPTVGADLYSLAATLYALLAGRPPRFPADGTSPGIATIMRLHDQPLEEIPGVPPQLMDVLRRGMAPDPALRPPTAAALRDTLTALTMAAPAPRAQAGPPPPAPSRPAPSHPGPAHPAPSHPGPRHAPRPASPASPAAGHPAGRRLRTEAATPAGPAVRRGTPAGSGPGDSPDNLAPAAAAARRRRSLLRASALAAGLVIIVGAAAIIGTRILPYGSGRASGTASAPPGARSPGAPSVFGIPTVTSGCPAASVGTAGARCPASAECWNGLVVISGNATAGSLPCAEPHVWQTFAIAILPADVRTWDYDIVQANATVRAVCSMPVLLKSRQGTAVQLPASAWEIDVLPPDEAAFSSGARAYRCVAHLLAGGDPRTSQFS